FGQLYDGLFDFFFQAEDGIRDRNVTGVQTCALPIFRAEELGIPAFCGMEMLVAQAVFASARFLDRKVDLSHVEKINRDIRRQVRSEERRVGKEWRTREAPCRRTSDTIEVVIQGSRSV